MSYMRDQHLLVTRIYTRARAATCKILSILIVPYIDTSLYTKPYTYTIRLRIRTVYAVDPCRHSVPEHCAGKVYSM